MIKILTIKSKSFQRNSIYTLQAYILQLILTLVEDYDKESDNFLFILNTINHKVLEETLL